MTDTTTLRRVLLLVTGGIAAYKSCYLVRRLIERNIDVRVAMTPHATEFVGPVTFEALSGNPVVLHTFDKHDAMEHIALADWAEVAIIAPATANVLAKMAHGIADDVVSTLLLSLECPILVAPAMNTRMWNHPATTENLRILESRGVTLIPPGEGLLACRTDGAGKMAEPDEIIEWVLDRLDTPPDLRGERLLVSAGPTQEALDPFRYISNPSSGRMGIAIAAAAVRCGAEVTLVHGPLAVAPPRLATNIQVRSAAEMFDAITTRFPDATGLIMSAAVADFTPVHCSEHKIKKTEAPSQLELKRTKDILGTLSSSHTEEQIVIGFCAESKDIEQSANRKLREKNLDAIVANSIITPGQGFQSPYNEVTVFQKDEAPISFDKMAKSRLALGLLKVYQNIRARKRLKQPATVE